MGETSDYLAIDLGAESGRGVLGRFDGERLALEEVHRFPNGPVRMLDTLHWDLPRLYDEVKTALRKAGAARPGIEGVGVDTWGVDFGLVGRGDTLLGNPVHYRDARTEGMMERAFARVPRERIYEITGLQFMPFNSVFQLLALKESGSPLLDAAETMLMMPDLFHYWFTGRKACEYSDASTSQFLNPRTRSWAAGLLDKLGLPSHICAEIVQPGTKLAAMLPEVAEECGSGPMAVIAPASHDTGSAVAAVPTAGGDWAYCSSGTWSLMGVETPQPYITGETLARNYTNEGGVFGTTRLLKNICGMWLLEECRREWSRQGIETGYDELRASAQADAPFRSVIDVDDALFVAPGGMPQRIADYCRGTNQPVPETPGQFARAIFESLALKYRMVIDDLAAITGRRAQTLHVVGGGSQSQLLNQFAADACQRPVVTGPVEATAMGNLLTQIRADGELDSLGEMRAVVRASSRVQHYEPGNWNEAAIRFTD